MEHHAIALSNQNSGESESSGSQSPCSDKFSDDQAVSRTVSSSPSPQRDQSPVQSTDGCDNIQDIVKILSEKLSEAARNITAKEDLVKQHAKVAEEAVAGWEKAENEVTSLKQHLETSHRKNALLEDQVSHLDDALKECMRQVRQCRDEQEEKICIAVSEKIREFESENSDLKNKLSDLQRDLESSRSEAALWTEEASAVNRELQKKVVGFEKENHDLRTELLGLSKDLEVLMLERDLSNEAAETASKHLLESVKRTARMEAECCRLRSLARRSPAVESLTDSLSDYGERMLSCDAEPGCSDSWASALIDELDQFKNGKAGSRFQPNSPPEIDLMEDFLEMEKLAALPEADHQSHNIATETDSVQSPAQDKCATSEIVLMQCQLAELQSKVKKLEDERVQLDLALADSKNQIQISADQLAASEIKLMELQMELELTRDGKLTLVDELETALKGLDAQLNSTKEEVCKLHEVINVLEEHINSEKAVSAEYKLELDSAKAGNISLEAQLLSAHLEVGNLRNTINQLESAVETEREHSSELSSRVEAVESEKMSLESELGAARLETQQLQQNMSVLETRLEEQMTMSSRFATKMEVAESARSDVEFQLKTARLEAANLHNKVSLLEGKIREAKLQSGEYASKCWKLEDELSRERRDAHLWRCACSNGDLRVKQEKELAVAAERLVECQKTIASLGQQLESLSNLDDLTLGSKVPETNYHVPDHQNVFDHQILHSVNIFR